jgi:hypothetical protein
MELLFLVPIIGLLAIYIAYREWLNAAHRQWLGELDLFKKRLAVYEALKGAVGRVHANGAVSNGDAERFAQAMADMHFLFDKELEQLAIGIHDSLLKKRALDALLAKAAGMDAAPSDKALIEQAVNKSQELSRQIMYGVYTEMPKRMERFMRPRAVPPSPRNPSLRPAPSAKT